MAMLVFALCVVVYVGMCFPGVFSLDCTIPSSVTVSGSTFQVAQVSQVPTCSVPVVTQNNVSYVSPELWVVANTTVTFQLTTTTTAWGFGLMLSPSSNGDPVGLTATASSLTAGSCLTYPTNAADIHNNTIAHDINNPQPCNVTWNVPAVPDQAPNNAQTYYYKMSNIVDGQLGTATRIHIVSAPSSSSSSSSTSSSTGTASSSSSSSASTGSSSSSSTGTASSSSSSTATGTGSNSSSSTGTGSSSSSSTGTGSVTGTSSRSFSSSSSPSLIGTSSSSSSSSSSAPNGNGDAGARVAVGVAVAVISAMWCAF